MRSLWRMLQLFAGLGLIAGLTLALQCLSEREIYVDTPGWETLRPLGDTAALLVHDEAVWIGGLSGLRVCDRRDGSASSLPAGAPRLRYVEDLLLDAEGWIWVAHSSGVVCYRDGEWVDREALSALLPGPVRALAHGAGGRVYIGGERGVLVARGDSVERLAVPEEHELASYDTLFEDREGRLWLGCEAASGGLLSYDGEAWESYTGRGVLVHNAVGSIIQDKRGALWFGLGYGSRGGVATLLDGRWLTLTTEDGLAKGKVPLVFEDAAGWLWIGSEIDGAALFDGRTWRHLTPADGLPGFEVKEMVQDRDGVYWIGTKRGLARVDLRVGTLPPAPARE